MRKKAATEALANALGPTWTDVPKLVEDLRKLGLSYKDIRKEADTLADALKSVRK